MQQRRPIFRKCVLASCLFLAVGAAQAEKPVRGGELQLLNYAPSVNPISFDPADGVWKTNQDLGTVYEQFIVGDLSKAKSRGGTFDFEPDGWIPQSIYKGELAESWELKQDPLRVEINLRKGVMFPEKPGVMAKREMTADDVVFSFERNKASSRMPPDYFSFVSKVDAKNPHQVVFYFDHFNAEWEYRLMWGAYYVVYPKEVVDKGITDWKNANGTGPFSVAENVQNSHVSYARNPDYWGTAIVGGEEHKLPFLDRYTFRTVKDPSTQYSMLRTGKVDIMEVVPHDAVEELKKSAPDLKWREYIPYSGQIIGLRVDQKPFDDIRVRRAVNMAINRKEIIDALYEGKGDLLTFPAHPAYTDYYEPLEALPAEVQELFTYDVDKAKQLLKEAGLAKGFTFKTQVCSCNVAHMEMMPLIAAYLSQINVTMEIEPLEYGAYFSSVRSMKHPAGYMLTKGLTNPTTALRNSWGAGDPWNVSNWRDDKFEAGLKAVYAEQDPDKRNELLKELRNYALASANYIILPSQRTYRAWWPWVKNYDGELRAGTHRPGPVYAQIWIDQDLKKKMGF